MWYVYVIYSKSHNRFYKGIAKNVERRLKEHNSGKTKSTKPFGPWELFFTEKFDTLQSARKREKFLKSGDGRKYIRLKWSRSSAGYLPAAQGPRQRQAGSICQMVL